MPEHVLDMKARPAACSCGKAKFAGSPTWVRVRHKAHVASSEPLPPACHYGYDREQIEQLMADDLDRFDRWMRGQTIAICDGREYDYEASEYRETGCGPHGGVVYAHDVANYLNGGQIRD